MSLLKSSFLASSCFSMTMAFRGGFVLPDPVTSACPFLSIDDNLLVAVVFLDVLLLNLLLQAEYDRAGCVNDFYIVAAGNVISFRGLSMSTQQHFGVVEVVEFLMVDGNQPIAFRRSTSRLLCTMSPRQ